MGQTTPNEMAHTVMFLYVDTCLTHHISYVVWIKTWAFFTAIAFKFQCRIS